MWHKGDEVDGGEHIHVGDSKEKVTCTYIHI